MIRIKSAASGVFTIIPFVIAARFVTIFRFVIYLCIGSLSFAGNSMAANTSNPAIPNSTIPNPTIEALASGTPILLGSTAFDLASVGYKQSEYFISGKARSYINIGALKSDGKWSVRVAGNAPYKTRILVYRPIDPAAFNGTVFVEWLDVSSGTESSSEWIMAHTELIRKGYAWVGVSAQKAGIEGGGPKLAGIALDLKTLNSTRYGSLSHPGDKYSFDIFSQSAQAILHPLHIDPLGGLHVERAIAAGEWQSADYMVTYVDAIAPLAKLFDGYFIHSRVHGTVGLAPPEIIKMNFAARPTVYLRDDLDVPVMVVQTETDMLLLDSYRDRQRDTAKFRWWEIAGAAHADLYTSREGLIDLGNDANTAAVAEVTSPFPGFIDCDKPVNTGPHHFVINAAIAALDSWLRDGVAPPYAPRLEIAGNPAAFVKDSVGNVVGGVRTPYVDVPVAALSGDGQRRSALCSLFGTTQLLNGTQLSSLYPDHFTFVSQINNSVDSAVRAGFLLQPDGDLIKAWARGTTIGGR